MSPFTTVYRIEHVEDRTGPFQGNRYIGWHLLDANNMPTPWNDQLDDDYALMMTDNPTTSAIRLPDWHHEDNWRFAFPSIENLRRWFSTNDCVRLSIAGFVIRTYRVPRGACIVRQVQVTFDPATAVEVATEALA